jgi:hypothetical protein
MKNKTSNSDNWSVKSNHLSISRILVSIVLIGLIAFVALPVFSQSAEDTKDWRFHDDLLNQLVGKWDLSGVAHGMQTKLVMQADWVLNHQYLSIYEKSDINVPGINVPYEEFLFIGYDKGYYDSLKHYLAHYMSVAGGDVRQDPFCSRSGNQLKLEFKGNGGGIEWLTWDPESRSWHIESRVVKDGKEGEQVIDFRAVRQKVN